MPNFAPLKVFSRKDKTMYINKQIMKRFSLFVVFVVLATAAFASLNGTGYYRIQNRSTSRYITIASGQFFTEEEKNKIKTSKSTSIDLKAMVTIPGFDNVVSDPASVIYLRNGSETDGKSGYDFVSQGMDTYASMRKYTQYFSSPHFQIGTRNGGYFCGLSGSYEGWSFDMRLCDSEKVTYDKDLQDSKGMVNTYDSGNNSWNIIPLSDANGYFGLKPDVNLNGEYYATLYASFAFTTLSPGMSVYMVDQVTTGLAVFREITGVVPANTPVIIKCASPSPSGNRLNILYSTAAAPSGNKLGGNFFATTTYNESTMRVLGKGADGSLAFVKPRNSQLTSGCIPANKAFLNMTAKEGASANDELRLISRADFEADPEITVTAANFTRAYGDANPKFTYTVEGGVAKGVPELTCEATATSPVGTYDIVVSKGSITNSAVNCVYGTLTVTKAPMTVKAYSYDRMTGDDNPDFEASYAGFRNRETASVFTVQPTFTCQATKDSPEGEYTIDVSGIESPNYEFTYQPGKLVVMPRRLTALDSTREYGDEDPVFTYYPTTVTQGDPELTTTATPTSPAGDYDIIISQGTVKNEGVDYVKGTLTVTKAPIDVTVGNYSRKKGEENPTFELVFSGLKFSEDVEKLMNSITIVCDATADSEPGEYPIVLIAGENDCYEFRTLNNGQLVVYEPDNVVVTANDYTREYGDANPEFSYKVSGTDLSGVPTLSCEATATSPAGVYPIVVSKGSVTNENSVFVNGTLTVTKAPVDVTVGTYTKKAGEENPVFELAFSGLKNSADADKLRSAVTITCEATSSSLPGEYVISLSSGTNDCYYFRTLTNGKLIVTEAELITVIANDVTRVYGEANPVFSYRVEGGTLDGEPYLDCAAVATSPVGTYPIVASKGSITNPSGVLVNGTLTIIQAPLVVTPKDFERELGEENPKVFDIEYQGWKNDENESVLAEKPVAWTIATKYSPVGKYIISVSGGEAQNYYFIYNTGTLTVREVSGITDLMVASGGKANVYTLSGQLVRANAKRLDGLKNGVYVVNGRKVVVK